MLVSQEKMEHVSELKMWSFFVEDQGVFAEAFVELNKGFSNGNYISLGMYTGGERK